MTTPYQTTGGYGVTGPLNSVGAPQVDPNAAVTPNMAAFVLSNTGMGNAGGYVGTATPIMSAILAELRVISNLLVMNSASNLDLSSMRADEASGATGGTIV